MLNLKKQQHRINRLFYIGRINYLLTRCIKAPLILCFHRICTPRTLLDRRLDAIEPMQFERLLRYLRSLGYDFISLDEMADRIECGSAGRSAVVTFDDGFSDLYEQAFPILRTMEIPFSLFLISGTVNASRLLWLHRLYMLLERLSEADRRRVVSEFPAFQAEIPMGNQIKSFFLNRDQAEINRLLEQMTVLAGWNSDEEKELAEALYMTREQLFEMQEAGCTIEAHGCEHRPLRPLDREETSIEIIESIRFIETEFGRRPRFFATSFGITNPYVADILKQENIRGLCTTEHRAVSGKDLYDLPRIYRGTNSLETFAWHITCALYSFLRAQSRLS